MDLSVDLWRVVRDKLTIREWDKACGTTSTSYFLANLLLAAEVSSKSGDVEDTLIRKLQLKRWPYCHSLLVNLWQLQEAARFASEQEQQLNKASNSLLSLQCLHVIGRDEVTLTESSMEGVLVRLIAKHAKVLTLQVKSLTSPWICPPYSTWCWI